MLRPADPFEESFVLLFPPVLASEATRGQFPSASCVGQRARQTEEKKKSCIDHFTSTVPLESIIPDDITHAAAALFRVLLLIELLNDVESFKTNSVFCVWWLNDMDFHHCGLSWRACECGEEAHT